MSRLAFLFRTDIHLSDNSPVSWKADYTEEIWNSLGQVGELAKQYQVNAVLDGGDYFHVKAPSKNSHYLVQKTALIHQAYSCPILMATGNHDIRYNNLETLERQPLGTLYASKVFEQLTEKVFEDGNLRVRVVGVPYNPNLTLTELMGIQKKKGDTHLIAVIHTLAALKPTASIEDFWNEPVFPYESLVSRNGPDVLMFGHWHKDQGVEVVGGKYFVNQGALSRGALVRENLERIPKVALIEFDGGDLKVQTFKLDVAPAVDVFDLEKKAVQERERQDIDQFVQRLVSEGEVDPDQTIEVNIKSLDFADEVRSEALKYLEMAEVG
jgi:DNA repair protein SbcD/Mre11